MESVFYSKARNNLRSLIDKVCDDYEEYLITTKDNKTAILISYDEYQAMKETLYLLSSKNNRERLLDSIEEIENNEFLTKKINL